MALSHFLKLNTGARMPTLGYGTFGGGEKLAAGLDYALHVGYRHIDTAWSYQVQPIVGEVISDWEKQGKIKRKDLFITTKVPGNLLSENGVTAVVEESLEQLRSKYVDMLLIHSIFGRVSAGQFEKNETLDVDINKSWAHLEKEMFEGRTKAIGVSNMSTKQMDIIAKSCQIKISNAQSECHAYLQQTNLRKYCMQMGIVLTGFGPLGAGGRPARHRTDTDPPKLLDDPVICGIASNISKTPAQVLLRFLVQIGVSPIPKSVTRERIRENIELFDFKLSNEDMELMKSVNKNSRFFKFHQYHDHKLFPHNEQF